MCLCASVLIWPRVRSSWGASCTISGSSTRSRFPADSHSQIQHEACANRECGFPRGVRNTPIFLHLVQAAENYRKSLALRGNQHRANFNLAEILYKKVPSPSCVQNIVHTVGTEHGRQGRPCGGTPTSLTGDRDASQGDTVAAKRHYQRGAFSEPPHEAMSPAAQLILVSPIGSHRIEAQECPLCLPPRREPHEG